MDLILNGWENAYATLKFFPPIGFTHKLNFHPSLTIRERNIHIFQIAYFGSTNH